MLSRQPRPDRRRGLYPRLDETIRATLKERIEFRKDRQVTGRKKRSVGRPGLNEICSPSASSEDCKDTARRQCVYPHTFSELKENFAANKVSVFNSVTNCGHHSTRSGSVVGGEVVDESDEDNLAAKTCR
jgi:hypothetical protein